MIYSLNGRKRLPLERNSQYTYSIYSFNGENKMFKPLMEDDFNTFNTNIWGCRSGEYYTGQQYLPEDYSNNAFVENGKLIVRNLKNNPTDKHEWSGAFVNTKDKFEFQYGIVAARIKFPSPEETKYYHATFWMLAAEGKGEIDIVEADNTGKDHARAWVALHYFNADKEDQFKTASGRYDEFDLAEYHTYVMYWNEEELVFHCDGNKIAKFKIEDATIDGINSFKQPFYLIFNTNPDMSGSGATDYESVTNMLDYVRVYNI